MKKQLLLTLTLMVFCNVRICAQMIAVNTDAMWWATMAPNLGLELVVGERSTASLNALSMRRLIGNEAKMMALQPEYRYYFSGRTMFREFIGIGGIGAVYDIHWKNKVYDGTALGLGLTFGYVLPLTKRLNVDFHAGFGYIHYSQKEYFAGDQYDTDAEDNGAQRVNARGYYLLPTRIGVSISYILK